MFDYQFKKEVRSAIPAVRVTLPLVFVMALVMLPAHQLLAKSIPTEYQYAVKLVCSGLLPHQDGDLVRGIYRTAVNIHNPTDEKVPFAFKVAVSGGINVEPSDPSAIQLYRFSLEGAKLAQE